jgi:opacity protein-like surface antigen
LVTSEFDAFSGLRTHRFDDTGSGFGGGVNFGYNWQVRGRYVVGVVGDINGLHEKVRHDFPFDAYIGSTMNFTASVQARGGVLVTPNVLLYGQGGLSISNQRLEIDFGGPETNESKIVPGFTLGGGIEWKLPTSMPWGKSTSVFVDYQHTWWDTARLDRPIAAPSFNYTWQRDTDKIDLGMRWRF